ncbi:MAG: hypothetical protein JWQ36_2955 [Enterovirga sp.]|jgi:hypothetical protein|nr:hypothetical protein [Enterovirga sp.]
MSDRLRPIPQGYQPQGNKDQAGDQGTTANRPPPPPPKRFTTAVKPPPKSSR